MTYIDIFFFPPPKFHTDIFQSALAPGRVNLGENDEASPQWTWPRARNRQFAFPNEFSAQTNTVEFVQSKELCLFLEFLPILFLIFPLVM